MQILRIHALVSLVLAATGVVSFAADDAPGLPPAQVQRCKKATALIDLGRYGSGSGFLVHASGLFVTNAHVVRELPPGFLAKLILNSGQPEQKIVSARVVLIDEENDLALLKTETAVAAEPLPLSDDAGLQELATAVVFGYPFGTTLASGSEPYPAISINAGRISSLRRDGAMLERIQLDATTNPGNSGGPLVDKDGKVIGIINSGIPGANVNFAVPAAKLLPILQKPVLSLKAPQIAYASRAEARKFEVEVFPTAPIPADATVAVRFGEAGSTGRKSLTAVRTDGRYFVTAAPSDLGYATGPLRLRLEAYYDQLELAANFDDCPVKIGDRSFRLSELRSIEQKTDAEKKTTKITTTLAHFDQGRDEYEMLLGKVTGLPTLRSKVNQVAVKLEEANRIRIGVYNPGALSVPYEIVLSSKGKPVASTTGALVFADPPRGLEFDEATTNGYVFSRGLRVDDLIKPEQDGKQGSWVQAEKGLETKADANAWCEIPVQPKNVYTLRLEVTPKQSGKGELLLWLPVGKANALVRIDGAKGAISLVLAEAKGHDDEENNVSFPPFASETKVAVSAVVRTTGKQAQVVVWVDRGRPLAWNGQVNNLVPHKEVPIAVEKLALGHHGLEMRVDSIRINGAASGLQFLREMPGQIRHGLELLLGRWTFDTAPTDDKLPSYFKGNSATTVGTPQIGVGPAVLGTGAMKLGGNSPSGIRVAETASSTRSGHPNRTLSMWFRADAPVPGDQRQYLYDEGANDKGFALYLEGSTLFAGGWDLRGDWKGTWLKATGVVAGQWNHVALVLDGQNADKTQAFHLYLNGTPTGAGFGQAIGAHESVAIGSIFKTTQASPESVANKAITNHQFAGLIDEVEIFNAVLGPGSISLLSGGRYGIGTPNDGAVSAPAPPPMPVVVPAATPPLAARMNPAPATPAQATPAVVARLTATPAPISAVRPAATPLIARPVASPSATVSPGITQGVKLAKVEAQDRILSPLSVGEQVLKDGKKVQWTAIAKEFEGYRFTSGNGTNPSLRFKVLTDGVVYFACTLRFFGNSSNDSLTDEKLRAAGWNKESAELTSSDKLGWWVYSRDCKAGEEMNMRTEKYRGPILLVK